MSDLAVATTSSSSMSVSQSQSMKTSFASSTSYSATGSSTTRTSTTVKSTKTVKTSKTSMTSTIGAIKISSSSSDSFAQYMGIDLDQEMAKLTARMDEGMGALRRDIMGLMPLEKPGTSSELVKLDDTSIVNYIDKSNKDMLRFNFDVEEFESESISVNAVGNKIEVHAKKKSKKGDEEKSEEYSRTYELPTPEVDSQKVTSSFYKDGVLTVQLPLDAAQKA